MNYTIHLFYPSVKDLTEAIDPAKLKGVGAYKQYDVSTVGYEAAAFVLANKLSTPPWVALLSAYVPDLGSLKLTNRSSSLALVIKTKKGRICAVTYGHAHYALDRSKVDQNFGLDAALNLVNPKKVRAIDTAGIGKGSLQKRQVAPKAGPLSEIPIRPVEDIRRVEGAMDAKEIGSRLAGSQSCRLITDISIPKLAALCEKLIAHSKKGIAKGFQRARPFVRVKDSAQNDELWSICDTRVRKGQTDGMGMLLPEIDLWTIAPRFDFQPEAGTHIEMDDLDLDSFLAALGADARALDVGKARVAGLDDDGRTVRSWKLRELLTAEFTHKGSQWALSNGSWYRLDAKAIEALQFRLSTFDRFPPDKMLEDMGDEDEGDYNIRIAAATPKKWLCLDKAGCIRVDADDVEPCDLLGVDGRLVHVKKWSASQTFSALIKQGENSADFLCDHEPFRKELGSV